LNQYFKYKFGFETENANFAPKLYNVSIDYKTPDCVQNITNTSWSNWTDVICVGNDKNQSRNLTEYDANNCGTFENVTFFEYQLLASNITFTDWTDWSNETCNGNNMNQSRSRVQYDVNSLGCFVNQTEYEYQLVGPTYQNTSWSDWTNISCLSNNKMNQSRNSTGYDLYGCVTNQTYFEFRNIEFCDYGVAPFLSIISPINKTYNIKTILLNINATHSAINNIWYNWNGMNITYTSPINITFNEGNNTLDVWANDTLGNVNYTNVSFEIYIEESKATEKEEPSSTYLSKGSYIPQTFYTNELFLERGNKLNLRIKDKIKFIVGSKNHTLTLESFNSESAKVKIESEPIFATLEKGILYEFDVSRDGINDLRVRYDGINQTSRRAMIFIQRIIKENIEVPTDSFRVGGIIQEDTGGDIEFPTNLEKIRRIISGAFIYPIFGKSGKMDYSLGVILILFLGLTSILIIKYSKVGKTSRYLKNSIQGLFNKKVYTGEGIYLGKIKEVILFKSRIDKLKIQLSKKHSLKIKGIIVEYSNVRGIGNIIILNESLTKSINDLEKSEKRTLKIISGVFVKTLIRKHQ
jgi:sporulation protein YlmC with PRC-barrel domain